MEFAEQLRQLGVYKTEMDILDVGCGEGRFFQSLVESKPGRKYDGVDIIDNLDPSIDRSRLRFFQCSFSDFVPDKKYDLIFARNTFFYQKDQIQQALRYSQYLKDDGMMCVSFMGTDDPWADVVFDGVRYYSITETEFLDFKKHVNVIWELENSKFSDTTLAGIGKDWHMYKIIFKKK